MNRRGAENTEEEGRRVSITVDSRLLEEVDKLTGKRSAAFEEGIRLWYARRIEEQLRKFYESRLQADVDFEEEWATVAQEQMKDILSAEGL